MSSKPGVDTASAAGAAPSPQAATGTPQAGAAALCAASSEFLAFTLGAQEYGIDLQRVQEIRSYVEPTCIASAPVFMKGVLNLRGAIVPVLDMRLKLGLGQARYDAFTAVIVLTVRGHLVGMVADSVSDVITLTAQQLRPLPDCSTIGTEPLLAVGVLDERMLLLVDVERLMSGADLDVCEGALD